MLGSRQSHYWFFNCYFWLLLYATFIFFIFTIFVFIFWLIFLPQELKFTITDVSLTKFSLTKTDTSSTLHYDLALNISIRNPNKKVGVYYGHIHAIANYGGETFAQVDNISTPFYQGHLSNTTIHVVLEGQKLVVLEESEVSRFKWETRARVYIIDVKLALTIKARYGKIKTGYLNSSEVDCQLKLPLSTSNIMFNVTDCESTVALPLLWP